jgi:signal transduction histidine kinase
MTVAELEAQLATLSADRQELFARLAELEAERTTQTMELFVMAAHELRTPLQSLIMGTDLVVDRIEGSADEVPRQWLLTHLHTQQRTLSRLQELMESWMTAPMVRANTLPATRQRFDLAELVREVVKRHTNDLAWAQCPLELSLESVTGSWNRMRVDTALTNLITNAMKYGAGRPIAVSVAASNDAAALMVRDQGIGIAPADQGRIFERFERASANARVPGFGIGLWMARALVRGMGGTVTVDSVPGAGATFTIHLPRAADE